MASVRPMSVGFNGVQARLQRERETGWLRGRTEPSGAKLKIANAFAAPSPSRRAESTTSSFASCGRAETSDGWARSIPGLDSNGEIYRIATITEDITERNQIAASHERLIRGVSHDVKNPLGAAAGFLSLLESGVFGGMTAPQLASVKHARRSIHHARDLVSQLLEIERADAGQLKIEREPVDLGASAREIVAEFSAAAAEKRLSLAPLCPGEGDSLVLESYRARVRRVLANLVSNAVKYTQPDGSVTVVPRLADEDERPWHGRWAAVSVVDDGPGIEAFA